MDLVLPKPGSYVIAVSGGVDSMALLDMLQWQRLADSRCKLVVAHLDHGIRPDSAADRRLVQDVARQHDLPFVFHEGRLGPGASEAEARQARYDFLRGVQRAVGAEAVITAHHQDDLLETAILNMMRGTGRKGLTSLQNRPGLLRPLLGVPKSDLLDYARTNSLDWREDATNLDQTYARNYVRHRILPRFSENDRSQLVTIVTSLSGTNQALDEALAAALASQSADTIDRTWFNHLPHAVAREVMAAWLRAGACRGFDSKTLERLVVAAKVAAPGKIFHILDGYILRVSADNLALNQPER